MIIRKAEKGDLDVLMPIFDEARGTIAKLGIDQWQDGYPQRYVIENDIENGHSHCVVDEADGTVCASFGLFADGEPDYRKIYDGRWLTGNETAENIPYIAIHRVAISVCRRGSGISTKIIDFAADYAKKHGKISLRIDTHEGNVVMRRMLEKHGFVFCGRVYLQKGVWRVGYEKVVG